MFNINVQFRTDGAAFDHDQSEEIARILDKAASTIRDLGIAQAETLPLFDINGNKVGSVTTG